MNLASTNTLLRNVWHLTDIHDPPRVESRPQGIRRVAAFHQSLVSSVRAPGGRGAPTALMIEGTLKLEWANRGRPTETPKYWVTFTAYDLRLRGSTQPRKAIIGRESLLEYILGIEAATLLTAQQWLLEIHAAGHLSLAHTQLTEEQYRPFRPVS